MAQLLNIEKVTVGTEFLTATIRVADDGPLWTSEDLAGTTRIYNLLPDIIHQACMGDGGTTFRDVMGDTALPHLLEHVTIELLAQTNMVDRVIAGRTWPLEDRLYTVQFPCVDDVLVAAALSSAVWLIEWAYRGGDEQPDVEGIVDGLVGLVRSLDETEDEPLDDADDPDAYVEDDYPADSDEDLDRGPSMSAKII